MAQASRNTRKLRRLKRENTLAYRLLDLALNQRDQARGYINYLANEINKKQARIFADEYEITLSELNDDLKRYASSAEALGPNGVV